MIKLKNLLNLIIKSSIYSLIVTVIDLIIFFIISGGFNDAFSSISLILLLEGGLCLVTGSGIVLYHPSVTKIHQVSVTSKPYSATDRKQIEKQMEIVIMTGLMLAFYGLIVSL